MVESQKMRLQSRAPSTTPCKSPIDCVAHVSTAQAFHKNGNKFNLDTFGREKEEYHLLKGFDKVKVVLGQRFDDLACDQNQQVKINKTRPVVSLLTRFCAQLIFFSVDPDHTEDGGFLLHFEEGQQLALQQGFQEVILSLDFLVQDSAVCNRGRDNKTSPSCAFHTNS
jgi:hypothetical protein